MADSPDMTVNRPLMSGLLLVTAPTWPLRSEHIGTYPRNLAQSRSRPIFSALFAPIPSGGSARHHIPFDPYPHCNAFAVPSHCFGT